MSKKTIKKLKRVQSLFLSVLIVFSMMTSSSLTVVDATEDEVINEIDETEETSTSEETVFEEVEEVQPTPEVKEEIPEEVVDEATQEEEVVIDDVPIDETVEEPQPTGTEEEIPEVVETPTEIVEETEEKPVEKPVEKDVKKAPAENTQRGARTDSSVAQIGDEFYDSLSAAVIAAEDGDTIVMIADSTESSENTLIAKKVTIDLAGHTITKPGFYEIEADVVVKDTSADHHGVIDAGFSVLKGEYGSQFTVESGTLTNASREVVTIHNSCQLVVGQNASILATGDNYAITTSDRVGFTVAEIYGTVKAKSIAVFVGTAHVYEGASITSETSTAILSRSSANTVSTTFINGGTIQGKIGLELDNAQGLQTIKSGEIIGEQYGVYIRNGNLSTALFTEASSAIIKATAGTSIAFDSNASENATATIYGGYFSDDAANDNRFVRDGGKYLSKGADPNYPDLYALTDHNVAKNATSNRYYLSLQEAINEANEGDSIELLKDHAENVSVNRSIQFDAKEYTLSNDGSNTNNGITLSVSGNTEFTFVGGTITTDRSNRAAVLVSGAASIQMRGGNITNTNTNNTMAALRINGTGNSTITGGTIISESNNQYGPAVSSANGSLTISGETYIEGKGVAAALYAGNPGGNDDGSITVDGGTIKNSGTGVAAYVNRGTMTINGGTIESVTANKSVGTASNGTFNINGGYYSDVAGNGDAFNRKEITS